MSAQQRSELDALLRGLPLDLGGDVAVQRPLMEQLMTAHALPDHVTIVSRLGYSDLLSVLPPGRRSCTAC